eukprot:g1724.t1
MPVEIEEEVEEYSSDESEDEGEAEEFWFPQGQTCADTIGTEWEDASASDKAYAVAVARGTQAVLGAKKVAHVGFIPLIFALGIMSCAQTPSLFTLLSPLPGM